MPCHSDWQEDESGLGKLRNANSSTGLLERGTLVRYTPEKESVSNEDVKLGSLGILLRYSEGWQKYLRGMEPVDVLFVDGVFHVYVDDLEVIR